MTLSNRTRLHLDADCSRKQLYLTLLTYGHDVTRTPNEWMPLDASDHEQLLGATEQQRVIFTFNISDFSRLSLLFPDHAGIVLGQQQHWPLARQLKALNRLLTDTKQPDWPGQVRWLNEWL